MHDPDLLVPSLSCMNYDLGTGIAYRTRSVARWRETRQRSFVRYARHPVPAGNGRFPGG